MAVEVTLPELSDEEHATVNHWHFKEGEKVNEGDDLVELQTDRALINIPSPVSGVILEILVEEGDVAEFGEALEHFQFRVERTRLMVPSRAWLYLSEERELKYWLGYHTFHLAERWTDELKKICQNEHVALAYDSSSVLSRGGWFFWHLSKKFFDGEMAARREFDSLLHRLEYLGVVATPNDILRAVCFDSNPLLDHRWLPNQ